MERWGRGEAREKKREELQAMLLLSDKQMPKKFVQSLPVCCKVAGMQTDNTVCVPNRFAHAISMDFLD